MKILFVGATGTIGSAVASTLASRGHDVIPAHRSSSTFPIDIADVDSIQRLLDQVGELDALACAAGSTPFAAWEELTRDHWMSGINSKFFGQVELVRRALPNLTTGGSVAVMSGVLARETIRTGTVATAVNAAIEGWVRASAAELWGRCRINAVSPTLLRESIPRYGNAFPGFPTTTAAEVAGAFVRSLEGVETGQVYVV